MPTGGSTISTCFARAALAGNPSDGYGGAVVAVPVRDLAAYASVEPGGQRAIRADDRDLHRLLTATADAFDEHVRPVGDVTVAATTTIPRSVGLAGSSALVIATLRTLADHVGHRFETIELAELALSIERERLGVEAGLQDRLVQAVGRPVEMTFDPVGCRVLTPPTELPLFVAWSEAATETSDTVHRALRRRFDADDAHVHASMAGLARQAHHAAAAIDAGDLGRLGAAMNRTFEIRSMMIDVDPVTTDLVETAVRAGAAANSAGSGGSIVGLARDRRHLDELVEMFDDRGVPVLALA